MQGQGRQSLALILAIAATTLYTVDAAIGEVKTSSSSSYYYSINAGSNSSHMGVDIGALLRERRALSNSRRSPFTEEEKEIMLDQHNKFRSMAKASDMIMLKWDKDLEMEAQRWADQCDYRHPDERRTVGSYSPIGQNLWASTHEPKTTESPVDAWHNEIKDYMYVKGTDTCKEGKVCGHYTQVVWAKTMAVGCAIKYCFPFHSISWENGYFVVCEYGNAGNLVGALPYQKGEECSKCPKEYKYCDKYLCSMKKGAPGSAGSPAHLLTLTLSHSGPANVLFTLTAYAAVAMITIRGLTLREQ